VRSDEVERNVDEEWHNGERVRNDDEEWLDEERVSFDVVADRAEERVSVDVIADHAEEIGIEDDNVSLRFHETLRLSEECDLGHLVFPSVLPGSRAA